MIPSARIKKPGRSSFCQAALPGGLARRAWWNCPAGPEGLAESAGWLPVEFRWANPPSEIRWVNSVLARRKIGVWPIK
jgi:hypothetical protein